MSIRTTSLTLVFAGFIVLALPASGSMYRDSAQGQTGAIANLSPQAKIEREKVLSLPLVANAMKGSDVEALLNRVGLLPVPEAQRVMLEKQFQKVLAEAVVIADRSRIALNEGEVNKIVDSLARSNASDEPTSNDQRGSIKSLRAKAIEIDLTLLNSAAHGLAQTFDPASQRMLDSAQFLRRADAAAETMHPVNGMPMPFMTISLALSCNTAFGGKDIDGARALLFSDAELRAELAERVSLALLEDATLDNGRASHDMQIGLTNALAAGMTVDPVALRILAVVIQMRGVFTPASELAKLDVALVQSIETALPLNTAFEMISLLEKSSILPATSGSRVMDIPQLTSKILALSKISVQQSQAVRAACEKWQRMDIQSFVSQLQTEAAFFSSSALVGKSIVVGDPQTWQTNPVSPGMQRLQKQFEKLIQIVAARRTAAKNTQKEFEVILGPELWANCASVSPALTKPDSK